MKKSDMKKAKNNDIKKDSFFKKAKSFLIANAIIVTLPITIPAIIWLGFRAYDLLFNWDLRAKKSYQREITVNFEYEGKDYTMKPIVKCINNGTAINEGSMEWYTDWSTNYQNNSLELNKLGKKAVMGLTSFSSHIIEQILEIKQPNGGILCDIFYDDNNVKNISRLMRNYNKEEKYYYNYRYNYKYANIIHIGISYDKRRKDRDGDIEKKKDDNSVKIKSYHIGEKILLK